METSSWVPIATRAIALHVGGLSWAEADAQTDREMNLDSGSAAQARTNARALNERMTVEDPPW